MSFPTHRHCEAKPKQAAAGRPPHVQRLLRPLRGLAMTAWGRAGALAMMAGVALAAPGVALAHPGHNGGLGHLHEWDLGFALLAALAVGGIAYAGSRLLAKKRNRRK